MTALFNEVHAYLVANYERDGNDILVECYDRAELEEAMGAATTLKDALRNIYEATGVMEQADYRDDIRGTAF